MQRNLELEATLVGKYAAVAPVLDERSRRVWAATESLAIGYGGDALVSAATGLARLTIRRGRQALARGGPSTARQRRAGAGRLRLEHAQPGLRDALEALVDPLTPGRPHVALALDVQESREAGSGAGAAGVAGQPRRRWAAPEPAGLPSAGATEALEDTTHPDRNAQFEYLNAPGGLFPAASPAGHLGRPQEEGAGRELQKCGPGMATDGRAGGRCTSTIFPTDSCGKAIPYGVYDMARNEAWGSVGQDTTRLPLPSRRFATGGRAWATGRIRRRPTCLSSQTRREQWLSLPRLESGAAAVRDETRLGIHVSHCRRGRASGTRLSIGSFAISPRTGAAPRCRRSRRSLTGSATRGRQRACGSTRNSTRASTPLAPRSPHHRWTHSRWSPIASMASGTTRCSLDEVGNFILIKVLSSRSHPRRRE